MVNGEKQLPDSWMRTTIGESLKIVRGISFPKDAKVFEPKKGYIACLRTANVQQEVEWDDLWFVPEEHVKREEQIIEANDILISTANSLELVGKVAQVKSILHKSTLGAFISLIRVPAELNPKFMYFQLASTKVQAAIRSKASTTTNISNISTGKLAEIELGYPPLPEQERIVAKIEELFTQLEAGTNALERVRAGLRRYKASVLKAAMEGKLGIQKDEFRIGEGELPQGWQWVKVEDLAADEKYSLAIGPFGSNLKVVDYRDEGVPLVFVRHIRTASFNQTHYVTKEKAEELKAHQIAGGDVLITKMGEPPGDACLYPESKPIAVITADCIKWRVAENLADKRFIVHMINSPVMQKQIQKITRGVAQKKVSLDRFRGLSVPLPPLEEQRRIVAEVERRLSVAREVESAVEGALVRASRLRQAVLKSAFEGRFR